MSVYSYSKYKIALEADSKKVQGLRTGDIVRRQYLDGADLIYSIMCVLEYGTETVTDDDTGDEAERSYFIGALLEGNVPKSDQLLEFARITSLFDTDRSGALYLTSSDDNSPYMDVIDGIGHDMSLSWPISLSTDDYEDAETQYVVRGTDAADVEYVDSEDDNSRICHFTRNSTTYSDLIGLEQDFYKYVANPNRVLIGYKIKASSSLSYTVSLGYQDGTRTDGEVTETATTDWVYKLHAITVDYSGRYLRTVQVDLGEMSSGDEVWIADFNIILLSSVTNLDDASQIRVGRLDGISDPVFGTLEGYGGYLQKLYASRSAHISGTLTAGDENGFAATFYAGKIHRNVFVNSLDVSFYTSITIDTEMDNPTGVGNVYSFTDEVGMTAQSNSWFLEHVDGQYTFSFWIYAGKACTLTLTQNDQAIGAVSIAASETLAWVRKKVTFYLQLPETATEDLLLYLKPDFMDDEDDGSTSEIMYFTAPQLESGNIVTQYQPTDATLDYTDDYGAWFSRGGIGGTIQNPLLRLNYDGEGSIGTSSNSLLIKTDGSGYLANGNITWDTEGNTTFGSGVKMSWDNLDETAQYELVSKYIKITGTSVFVLVGDASGSDPTVNPSTILLTLEEENLTSTSSQRQWYYLNGYEYVAFDGENGSTLLIYPNDEYWTDSYSLTVRCEVTIGDNVYADNFTITKQYLIGYSLEITSSSGMSFKNNSCTTTLTANVYYQGQLVDPDYADENYTFSWKKYALPDLENEVEGWADEITDDDGNVLQEAIDTSAREITVSYSITGQDMYVCTLVSGTMFPYEFPLIFSGSETSDDES